MGCHGCSAGWRRKSLNHSQDEWPVIRDPDCNPVTERDTRKAADQREQANGTRPLVYCVFDLMARGWRVNRKLSNFPLLESRDRIACGIQFAKQPNYAAHQSNSPGVSGMNGNGWAVTSTPVACRRLRRGFTISLISVSAMTGNCFTNSRNHIENQPNDPHRIA